MKSIIPIFLLFSLGILAGCQSKTEQETITPVSPTSGSPTTTGGTAMSATTVDITGQTLVSQGTFMNNVHSVSGQVSVYEKAGKRTLVFSNFRTDSGPDLRIYLAENTGLRNFIEVSRLNVADSFAVELPADADPTKQRFVLIWCKAFSVLFGNAELK